MLGTKNKRQLRSKYTYCHGECWNGKKHFYYVTIIEMEKTFLFKSKRNAMLALKAFKDLD